MIEFSGKGLPLSQTAVSAGIDALGIEPAAFWAVMAVETRGFGFLKDRRPLILYERHIFHTKTNGKFSAAHPDISNSKPGGYGTAGGGQYPRLARAVALNREAALQSASWGLGQVMGFNASVAGFASVEAMVLAMAESEDAQCHGMVQFILAHDLAQYLRAQNWAKFALRYNGEGFKKNDYDTKLRKAFNLYTDHPTPSLDVRACQAALTYLGFDPKGVDGLYGFGTQKSLMAWQKARQRPVDGKLSDDTLAALKVEAF